MVRTRIGLRGKCGLRHMSSKYIHFVVNVRGYHSEAKSYFVIDHCARSVMECDFASTVQACNSRVFSTCLSA